MRRILKKCHGVLEGLDFCWLFVDTWLGGDDFLGYSRKRKGEGRWRGQRGELGVGELI